MVATQILEIAPNVSVHVDTVVFHATKNRKQSIAVEQKRFCSKKKTFKLVMGYDDTTKHDDFKECYYWIKNPEKKTVKLTIKSLKVGSVNVACNYGGIEIKSQKNQLMSGYRFCDSNENKGKVISSSSSIIPVIAYIFTKQPNSSWSIAQASSGYTHPADLFRIDVQRESKLQGFSSCSKTQSASAINVSRH
ncbi:unnamed protein product [Cylicocyclus nassatus]|uniref:CUB domain-containing protein n=1 Tax=Cylicocyclus nassatus TaxID=53992 RepID=A0AA36GPP1_CYLNA|nr:unnamed protein product [Cylicocyclus nassatus]